MARVRDLDAATKLELIEHCYKDPPFFCRTILPEWFPLPMPWFHRGMLAIILKRTDFLTNFGEENWDGGSYSWDERGLDKILRHFVWKERPDDPTCPEQSIFIRDGDKITLLTTDFTLMMIPRGFSKTTIVNAASLFLIIFKMVGFVLYISESSPHAEMQLQNIKTQLSDNEKITTLWGDFAPSRNAALKWRDDYIETLNGVTAAARGRGGQIRGLIRNGKRPDLIVCDDIEDEESVKTVEQRKKARKWLLGTVKPALKKIGIHGRMIMMGTALAPDALLMNLKNDPTFLSIIFGAIDRDGEALWADNMSLDALEKTKQSFILGGELGSYYLEYHSLVRTDDTALFDSSHFRYQAMTRDDFVGVSLVCDPAISTSAEADFCSFGVVGIDARGRCQVLDIFMKRGMDPREQIDKFFELNHFWRPTHRGVEANAYQKSLIFQIKADMFEKSRQYGAEVYFPITAITNKAKKAERIRGILAPRYRSGYIVHQRRFPELEQQLLDYPGKHDDGPDVIAMCIQLLDPFASLAADPDQIETDRYIDIELEIGEWRNAP